MSHSRHIASISLLKLGGVKLENSLILVDSNKDNMREACYCTKWGGGGDMISSASLPSKKKKEFLDKSSINIDILPVFFGL